MRIPFSSGVEIKCGYKGLPFKYFTPCKAIKV